MPMNILQFHFLSSTFQGGIFSGRFFLVFFHQFWLFSFFVQPIVLLILDDECHRLANALFTQIHGFYSGTHTHRYKYTPKETDRHTHTHTHAHRPTSRANTIIE